MTAPLATIVPSLVVSSALIPAFQAQNVAQAFLLNDPSERSSTQYVLAGAVGGVALGTILAGCSESRPAPIPNESAIPPNQKTCTPESRSPYCQGQREVLSEMHRMREEGHHSDQSLFFISGGVVLFVGLTVGLIVGRRWGRKKAMRAMNQQQAKPVEPPQEAPPASEGVPKVGE